MMDASGQRCLLDTTIMNNKCTPWLGHIMKLLTDTLNVLGVCQIPTGIHCISMEQWNNGTMFHAIANITHLIIMDNEPFFQVDYDENHNSHP